jgi:hypothetical protein
MMQRRPLLMRREQLCQIMGQRSWAKSVNPRVCGSDLVHGRWSVCVIHNCPKPFFSGATNRLVHVGTAMIHAQGHCPARQSLCELTIHNRRVTRRILPVRAASGLPWFALTTKVVSSGFYGCTVPEKTASTPASMMQRCPLLMRREQLCQIMEQAQYAALMPRWRNRPPKGPRLAQYAALMRPWLYLTSSLLGSIWPVGAPLGRKGHAAV